MFLILGMSTGQWGGVLEQEFWSHSETDLESKPAGEATLATGPGSTNERITLWGTKT